MSAAVDSPTRRPDAPYVGLDPFGPRHAFFFAGRERERRLLAATLLSSRFSVLYGASGVGKSSLVGAGLGGLFRSRANEALAAGRVPEAVLVVNRRWSDDPVAALSTAVERAVREQLRELAPDAPPVAMPLDLLLLSWARRIEERARELRASSDEFVPRTELLLVLDQFEEYFLYHPNEDADGTLAAQLPDAVARDDLPANFLLSIRGDAYTQLDRFEGRIRNLFASNFALEHLDEDAARAAIREPIDRYNELLPPGEAPYAVEDRLVDEVVEQVRAGSIALGEGGAGVVDGERNGDGAAGALIATPFLQLVMTRLWEEEQRARSRLLRAETLDRLGGAERLVRSHLEEALTTMNDRSQRYAAAVFHQLVTPSGTKIAHSVSDLADYADTKPQQLEPVLDALAARRILRPVDPPPGKTERRFEIFHDVLAGGILAWRGSYEQRRIRRRWVTVAAGCLLLTVAFGAVALWAWNERSTAQAQTRRLIAVSGSLDHAEATLQQTDAAAAEAEQKAATADQQAQKEQATANEEQAAAQQAQTAAANEATAAEQARVAQAAARAAALAAVRRARAASVLADRQRAVAARARARAQTANRAARAQRLAALALAQLAVDPVGALQAAVAAVEEQPTQQAESALRQALAAPYPRVVLTGHTDGVEHAAFSPDGRRVVTASWDKSARIWDAATGKQLVTLPSQSSEQTQAFRDAEFSPDGTRVVTGSAYDDWIARVWEPAASTTKPVLSLTGHQGAIRTASYSRDGKLIVTASDDSTARVWDARTGALVAGPFWHPGPVRSAAFSPDARRIATGGDDGVVRIWDVATQSLVAELKGHTAPVNSVAFSPDGSLLASSGEDHTARIWDVATGRTVEVLAGHSATVDTALFDPAGDLVVTASSDGTARVWDVASGQTLTVLRGHSNALNSAAFSPDGRSIVTSSWDLTARIWPAPQPRSVALLPGHAKPIDGVAVSRDGRWIATASEDSTAQVWDARLHTPVGPALAHPGKVLGAAFSPDGSLLATACGDGKARVWDWRAGRVVDVLTGGSPVTSVAFSPDGRLLAAGEVKPKDVDEEGVVWAWRSHTVVWHVHGHTGPVYSVAFSPNGKLLVSAGLDGRPWVWRVATGEQLEQLSGHSGGTTGAAFSPDSRFVVTTSNDATARLWSVATGKSVAVLTGHSGIVTGAAFSPDGQVVATAGQDGTARLWDAWSGASLAVLPGRMGQVRSVAFSPDGSTIVIGGEKGGGSRAVARLYRCEPRVCGSRATLLALAHAELARR